MSGGRHLTARLLTSPLWSSNCLSTTAHTFFSTSGAARKFSLYQGHTLVHFSAQPELFLTLNTAL
jgi:hypothetical protein